MTQSSLQHMVGSDCFLLGWQEESGWGPSFPVVNIAGNISTTSEPSGVGHHPRLIYTLWNRIWLVQLPYTSLCYKAAFWMNTHHEFLCTLGWSEMLNLNDAALASSYNKPGSQLLVIWVIFHFNMAFTLELNLPGSQHPAIDFWIATPKSSYQFMLVFPMF